MAADEELNQIKADFGSQKTVAQRILDQLAENEALAAQIGDTLEVANLRAEQASIANRPARVQAGEVENATAAIEQQTAALQRAAAVELEQLDILKQQTAQRAEQAAVTERLASSSVILPPRRGVREAEGESYAQGQRAEAQAVAALQAQRAEAEAANALQAQRVLAQRAQIAAPERRGGPFEQLAGQRSKNEALAQERALRAQALSIQEEQAAVAEKQAATEATIARRMRESYGAGASAAGRAPYTISSARQTELLKAPAGLGAEEWGRAEAGAAAMQMELGRYNTFAATASLESRALTANLTRLGMVEAEASNSMRVHGALTTEYLGALVRGETTISELGYQVSATIGKFAGWTIAASAVYTALGAVYEFGKGAIETAASVQQLTRTIEDLDKQKASTALQNLSAEVNVPIKEAGEAVFLFSRTFHNLDDAVTAARLALATFKLDGVAVADSVKAQTAIHQQFGITAQGLVPIYDELAQGQQKFNARVTEQIPALLKSSAAVKIAGGDLRSLIQLTTIALRTTSLSGSQVGTAFSRSAANFLNPTTTKGQADRQVLKQLGLDTSLGYTDLIFQAISKAPSLSPNQISKMTQAIFGPLRGGLMAGLFTGGPGLLGPVGRELSPQGSRNVLQTELAKELGTITQQLHAFVNGLQRVGAALAETGTLTPFGLALKVIVTGIDALRGVIDIFDQLPHAAKQVASGLVEARIAMLLLSRTRIGGSVADATGLSRLGLGPTQETRQRQALGKGTFNAMKAVEGDFARTQATLLTNAAQQAEMEKRHGLIEADIARSGVGTRGQYAAANKISAEILVLQDQANELALKSTAQLAVQRDLETQYIGVRKRSGPKAYSKTQVSALIAETESETAGLAARTVGDEALAAKTGVFTLAARKAQAGASAARTALIGASVAEAELAASTTAEAVALQEAVASDAQLAVAMTAATAAALETAVAADAETVEAVTLGSALKVTAAGVRGMAGGFLGMIGAMDPLLLAMVGLPLVFELLSHAGDSMGHSLDAAKTAISKPITSLAVLRARANAMRQVEATSRKRFADFQNESGASDLLGDVASHAAALAGLGIQRTIPTIRGVPPTIYPKGKSPWDHALGLLTNPYASLTSGPAPTQAAITTGYSEFFDGLDRQARQDAKHAKDTNAGRAHYYDQLARLKQQAQQYLQAHPGVDGQAAYAALATQLQHDYEAQQKRFSLKGGAPDLFAQFDRMSVKDIRARVQGLDDLTKALGGGVDSNAAIKQASAAVAYLGGKINKGSSSADLQAFGTAMQNFQDTLHTVVQNFLHAATTTSSSSEETSDIAKARAAITNERRNIEIELKASIKRYRGNKSAIRKAIAEANQRLSILADELQSVNSAADTQLQTASALAVAKIAGASPEADIARARVALSFLRQRLAAARASGADAKTVADLLAQVETASQGVIQQTIDNARAIMDANAQVTRAQIGGTGPAADLARARADVSAAAADLGFDRAHHAGQAKITQDYAALLNAQNAVNDQIRQNAQAIDQDAAALIQARAGLAEAQTTDPIKQARIQLAADLQVLKTIKPSDYKTYAEYQTAVLQQQAKIAQDRTGLTQQWVDVQMRNLQFELHTQRITDQQYINGLQQLLKAKKLSIAERQQIQTALYDATNSDAVSLNLGSLKMPTTYEVKRAISGAARRMAGGGWSGIVHGGDTVNNNQRVTVNVHVSKETDLKKVAKVFDDAMTGNLAPTAQAMGMI